MKVINLKYFINKICLQISEVKEFKFLEIYFVNFNLLVIL